MLEKWIHKMRKKFTRTSKERDINQEELEQFQKEGALLIDVRNPLEYKEGHLEQAISLPEYEINNQIKDKIETTQILIVYCSSGKRSKKAQKKLEKMGYEQVYNLEGGFFS